MAQVKAQKEISEAQLAALSDQSELRNEIRGLQAEIRELGDQLALYEVDRRIAQYNDGYSRGSIQHEPGLVQRDYLPGQSNLENDEVLRPIKENGRNRKL